MAEIPPAKQNRPQVRGLYKVTLLCYRKPGMSEEDFHHHWTKIHSAKVSDFLRSHGVVGYTQVCGASSNTISSGACSQSKVSHALLGPKRSP